MSNDELGIVINEVVDHLLVRNVNFHDLEDHRQETKKRIWEMFRKGVLRIAIPIRRLADLTKEELALLKKQLMALAIQILSNLGVSHFRKDTTSLKNRENVARDAGSEDVATDDEEGSPEDKEELDAFSASLPQDQREVFEAFRELRREGIDPNYAKVARRLKAAGRPKIDAKTVKARWLKVAEALERRIQK